MPDGGDFVKFRICKNPLYIFDVQRYILHRISNAIIFPDRSTSEVFAVDRDASNKTRK